MKIVPLNDRVIIRPDEAPDKVGRIIIPNMAKEKPQLGVVVAVGKGKPRKDGSLIPMVLKEGDRVLFGKYTGTEIKIVDTNYLMIRQDDIFGVIENGK